MDNLFIALLHHPVYNREGKVVTTSVANMDIHDIARAARTYGARRFYIVTPVAAQQSLVETILSHWRTGFGATYTPSRKEAFSVTHLCNSLDEVRADVAALAGREAKLVVTSATPSGDVVSFSELRENMDRGEVCLVIIGTGWGIAEEVIRQADYRLAPLTGPSGYNHLSARSAAAIILDRLRGARDGQ
jgi:hypothetical protein